MGWGEGSHRKSSLAPRVCLSPSSSVLVSRPGHPCFPVHADHASKAYGSPVSWKLRLSWLCGQWLPFLVTVPAARTGTGWPASALWVMPAPLREVFSSHLSQVQQISTTSSRSAARLPRTGVNPLEPIFNYWQQLQGHPAPQASPTQSERTTASQATSHSPLPLSPGRKDSTCALWTVRLIQHHLRQVNPSQGAAPGRAGPCGESLLSFWVSWAVIVASQGGRHCFGGPRGQCPPKPGILPTLWSSAFTSSQRKILVSTQLSVVRGRSPTAPRSWARSQLPWTVRGEIWKLVNGRAEVRPGCAEPIHEKGLVSLPYCQAWCACVCTRSVAFHLTSSHPLPLSFLFCFVFFLLCPQKSEVHLQETAKECVAGLWFAKERKKERREKRKEIHTKVYSLPPCKPLFLSLCHIHARTHTQTHTHTAFSIMFMKKKTSSPGHATPPSQPLWLKVEEGEPCWGVLPS